MKIKVYKVPKKEFEKEVGKYAYGVSGYENGTPVIGIKDSIKNKKIIKGTMEHELGHIFSEKRHITRKLPIEEKRQLLNMARDNEGYKKRGTVSGKAMMQEQIADLYGYSKYNDKSRKILQEAFPKTMAIIKRERKKFKPRLVRRKYD